MRDGKVVKNCPVSEVYICDMRYSLVTVRDATLLPNLGPWYTTRIGKCAGGKALFVLARLCLGSHSSFVRMTLILSVHVTSSSVEVGAGKRRASSELAQPLSLVASTKFV